MHPIEQPITGRAYRPELLSDPTNAVEQFYAAFNARDLALMSTNWSPGAAAMDNPLGGIARGWEAIRAIYARIFTGAARVQVEFHDYTLHESADIFYVVGRERGTLVLRDERVELAIRTTRIYRREEGAWRQVHHHGSIDDPALLARYQQLVRGAS